MEALKMKSGDKRISVSNAISGIIIAISVIVLVYCLRVVHVSPFQAFKIVLLFIFYLILPGYLFARKTADMKDSSQVFALSMLFSTAACIFSYFADELLTKKTMGGICGLLASVSSRIGLSGIAGRFQNGYLFGFLLGPILSVVSIILLIKDIKSKKVTAESFRIRLPLLALISVMVVLSFGTLYSQLAVSPQYSGTSSVYYDVLWLAGNDASLVKGWPTDGFQYLGKQLNSNIGANLVRAALSRAGSISSVRMYGIYSTFFTMPFLALSVDALSNSFFKDRKKAFFSTFTFVFVSYFSRAIFFVFNGAESFEAAGYLAYYSNAAINIFVSPNGIDLAIPAVALLALLVIDYFRREDAKLRSLIPILIAAFVCSIGKYVFMVCVFGALAGTFILRLIQKRGLAGSKKIVAVTLTMMFSFAVVFFTVIRGGAVYMPATKASPVFAYDGSVNYYENPEYEYESSYSEINLGASVLKTELFARTMLMANINGDNKAIPAALHIPVHFFLQMILTGIPFFIWIVCRFKKFRSFGLVDMFIGGIAICGILAFYLLSVDGLSQAYFFFCASVFINMCGAGFVYDHFSKAKVLICLALIIGLTSSAGKILMYARPGFEKVARIARGDAIENDPVYDGITDYEYEAMMWLKDNTDPDAVIAIDRHYRVYVKKSLIPEPNQYESRYYYYTGYSERQAFIGSWAYLSRTEKMQSDLVERLIANDALYDNLCINRREIMEKNGISYIVVSRFVHPDLKLKSFDLREVFSNRDITIYALS